MVRTKRRWRVHVGWAIAAVVAVGVTYAATNAISRPGAEQPTIDATPTYTVVRGEVGVQAKTQADLTFASGQTVHSGASGTITSVGISNDRAVESGTVAATVDLRPVVIAPGVTPAFRDMSLEMRGPDVAQLRAFLGLEEGDYYSWAVYEAVAEWQRSLGVPDDGTVRLGDIVFVELLPASIVVNDDLMLGSPISSGDELFTVLSPEPSVAVAADNQGLFVAGMTAHLILPDGTSVSGTLTGPVTLETGVDEFAVVGADGASPCAAECAVQLAGKRTSRVAAQIEVVPMREGLVVPDAAIVTRPDGTLAVRATDGSWIAVTIDTRGQGVSIVTGVNEGQEILLFGEAKP